MADNDSGQEKTEQPTSKRLNEAKEQGKVARSRELSTLIVVLVGTLSIFMFGASLMQELLLLIKGFFSLSRTDLLDPFAVLDGFYSAIKHTLKMLLPFFIVMIVAAVAAPLSLGGWSFSMEAISFKAERLDPVKGLKRVFGAQGLLELAKAMVKFFLLLVAAIISLNYFYDGLMALGLENVMQAIVHSSSILFWSILALCTVLLIVALVDVPFQLWNHARSLRMSRQEVKDEMKQTEGDPELRGKIKSIQREMSKRRMMQDVPDADVVLVNPTHFAVALKYDGRHKGAPRVVAKGADVLALKIREIATHHKVYIYSEPALTRAIYHSTKVGSEIPAALYVAVAQVLAFVFHINRSKKYGGKEPDKPDNLPIPEEYLQHSEREEQG